MCMELCAESSELSALHFLAVPTAGVWSEVAPGLDLPLGQFCLDFLSAHQDWAQFTVWAPKFLLSLVHPRPQCQVTKLLHNHSTGQL